MGPGYYSHGNAGLKHYALSLEEYSRSIVVVALYQSIDSLAITVSYGWGWSWTGDG